MKVKIIKKPDNESIWYCNQVGDIIEVEEHKTYDDIYVVVGPKEMLDYYYYREYNFSTLGVNKKNVRDLRKEKIESILKDEK